MTKGMVVIDIPNSCADCDIRFTDEYSDWCPVNIEENQTDVFDYANNFTKPDWCPVKPMPEKIKYKNRQEIAKELIAEGWNACLDKILGE